VKQKFIIDIENRDVFVALSQEWGQERAVNYFKGIAKQEPVFLRGNTNRAKAAKFYPMNPPATRIEDSLSTSNILRIQREFFCFAFTLPEEKNE
jgi:hypothetical protein